MTLSEIEQKIRDLHARICLRTNVMMRDVGMLLLAGKKITGHGEYQNWYRRAFGFQKSTACDYTQLARVPESKFRRNGTLTIRQFIRLLKQGRELERGDRPDAPETPLRLDAELHHADCREFDWAPEADCIVADPPWADDMAYCWLAGFAAERLRPGGLLFVQLGNMELPNKYDPFLDAGLVYHWTLAIIFENTMDVSPSLWFASGWRPVLVFSQGKRRRHDFCTDTYTVQKGDKDFHPWQQPLAPWCHWLTRMTPPGSLVFDPFAGSGTVGVACVETGRRYVGTEKDARHARVARHRIGKASRRS